MEEKASLEAELRQAQKLEAIGRLAGGVAHNFNNMLGIMLGNAETLLRELPEGDPLQEDVREILKAGKRSAELTRQLLAFSRKQVLRPEVLDLTHTVRNVEKLLRRVIGEDIALELKCSEGLSRVVADPGQVEQVLMNLAVNARDAMPAGGKLLVETASVELDEVYTRHHEGVSPGPYVMVAVSDTGCGMGQDLLSHIFDPFYTTKEQGKGTGLGLSTVYGIIKQSGGTIWVYSEPEIGTTFKIYLPQTEAAAGRVDSVVEETEWLGGGERILVVEDEDGLRNLLVRSLSRLDLRVTAAWNGTEACRLIEKSGLTPDLLITDMVMPEMGGAELVKHLRATMPNLKVLYMSGYTNEAIVQHGVLSEETPFIQKPFTIRCLISKIHAVLRG